MTLVAAAVALLVGLTLGALGGGGAVLAVPAFVHLLDQTPQQAMTASLVVVGVTSLVALVPHARRGNVRVAQGLTFGAVGTIGSYAGARVSAHLPDRTLMLLFAVLLVVIAAVMVRRFRRAAARPATSTPATSTPAASTTETSGGGDGSGRDGIRVLALVTTASAVGFLTGLLGVGGGFVVVPALTLALALPMPVAVGTSLLVIAVNSATALVARTSVAVEGLDWPVIALFTAVAVMASLVGTRLAAVLSARQQAGTFAALLLVVAAVTGVGALA